MKITYISNTCSKDTFFQTFSINNKLPGQQVQKFNRLILEGLAANKEDVTALSLLPINRQNYSGSLIRFKPDVENGVKYYYLNVFNMPILKNLCSFVSTFLYVTRQKIRKNIDVLIFDPLNLSITLGGLLASKMFNIKSMGIITDFPIHLVNRRNIYSFVTSLTLQKFDSYVLLTEQMKTIVIKKNQPYIVLEGLVDYKTGNERIGIEEKYRNVTLYAGSLNRKYGIENLVNAFVNYLPVSFTLHIYGNGDFEEELVNIVKNHENIKYFGVRENDYIIKEEQKANLLVNPRPTNEAFTQYSFPSKNMEYMLSGTATMTTMLPGMPKEYYPYVFLTQDDPKEISRSILDFYSLSTIDSSKFGEAAKSFVLTNKNNITQTARIVKIIKSI